MRCTLCSHEVICLVGRRWNADVNYFFFRNAVPDIRKLEAASAPDARTSAYCCQCAWTTAAAVTNVTAAQQGGRQAYAQEGEATAAQLRWVCGKRMMR
jgi:hypothetical protein